MRIPIEWLKEFINFELSTQKLAEKLSLFGLEIDEYKDNVLDFKPTPNRGDCLSVLGTAREVAAIIQKKIKPRKYFQYGKKESRLNINFENKNICPRYTYRIIENVRIKESPAWIKSRLKACRMRPINNVVDATNYVMLELGQPLHAFDCDKIHGDKMNIRFAKKGEKITTLDGTPRALTRANIVIEDKNNIIDLAGLMGGINSEISKNTNKILLQAAIFDPVYIRKSSKALHHQTEASYRYERGIDPMLPLKAIHRASELISEFSQKTILSRVVDIQNVSHRPAKINISLEQICRLLGIQISQKKVINYLNLLGFSLISTCGSTITVRVPSWRLDIKIKEDLIEEIGRMYGNNKLPKTYLPKRKINNIQSLYYRQEVLKDILFDIGLTEVNTYSFVSKRDLDSFNINSKKCLKINNPISSEGEYMRPNLFINLLKILSTNPNFDPIELFEIGNVFNNDKNQEHLRLGILAARNSKFRSMQKILTRFFNILKISHDQRDKLILTKTYPKNILSNYKTHKPKVKIIEIDLNRLFKIATLPQNNLKIFDKKIVYQNVSKFPSASRDLAVVVESTINPDDIAFEIKKIDNLVNSVVLFDEYSSDKLGKNKKSLAYHIFYASSNKTLSSKKINDSHQKIIKTLSTKFGAKLRGL